MHDLWLLLKPTYIVSQFTRCLCFLIFHLQNWITKIKNPGSLFPALFFSVESFLLGLTFHPGRALISLPVQGSGRAPSYCCPGDVQILLPWGVSLMLERACSVHGYCSRVGFLRMNLNCSRNGAGISPGVFSAF